MEILIYTCAYVCNLNSDRIREWEYFVHSYQRRIEDLLSGREHEILRCTPRSDIVFNFKIRLECVEATFTRFSIKLVCI